MSLSQGAEVMTSEVKALFQQEFYYLVKCQKCDYEIGYFHNLANWKATVNDLKRHLIDVHKLRSSDL